MKSKSPVMANKLRETTSGGTQCLIILDSKPQAHLINRDAKGVEVEQPNEKETIQAVSDQFNRFQMYNFNEHMHCLRGTHLKTQGVSSSCSSRC